MKNLLLSLLALTLFAVMIGVSFMKAERSNRIEPRVVEQSLRSETITTPVGSAENAIPSVLSEQTAEKPKETGLREIYQIEESSGELAKQDESPTETPPVILSISKVDASAENNAENNRDESQAESEAPLESVEKSEEPKKVVEVSEDERILDYFQERLNILPTDLTSYEKKVAIKEVRDEVCLVFKITLAHLKKLTKKRTIRYP